MYRIKPWEELTIQDDYMFKLIMSIKHICLNLLQEILHMEIRDIHYLETEKSMDARYQGKGIRMDVYVRDDAATVYNIEMQTTKGRDGELPRRARYYQGMIDMDLLGKGVYYDDLRQTYIIFICTFDLFGLDERIYTFRNRCVEQPEIELGDGTTKIFLNAKGLKGNVDEELEDFLQYVDGKEARSRFAQEMAQEVERVKRQDEMRREFVTLYMEYQKHHREGLAKGIEQGRREGRREGREEGRTEGRQLGIAHIAMNMLRAGTPIATVAQMAELPEAVIRKMAEEHGVEVSS